MRYTMKKQNTFARHLFLFTLSFIFIFPTSWANNSGRSDLERAQKLHGVQDPVEAIIESSGMDGESEFCAKALSTENSFERGDLLGKLKTYAAKVGAQLKMEGPVDEYIDLIKSRRDGLDRSQALLADPMQSLVFYDLQWSMRIVQILRQGNAAEAKSQLYGLFDSVHLAVRDILLDAKTVREYRALTSNMTLAQKMSWTYIDAWWKTRQILKRLEKNMKILGRNHFRYSLVQDVLDNTDELQKVAMDYAVEQAEAQLGSTPDDQVACKTVCKSVLQALGLNSRVQLELTGKLDNNTTTPTEEEIGLAYSTRVEGAGDESAKAYLLKYRRAAGMMAVAKRVLTQPYLWKLAELLGKAGVGVHEQLLGSILKQGGNAAAVNEVLNSWAESLRMMGKSVWVRNTDIPELFYMIYAIKPNLVNEKFEHFKQAFNRRGQGLIETFALLSDVDAETVWEQMLEVAKVKDPNLHALMLAEAKKVQDAESQQQVFKRINLFAPEDRMTLAVRVLAPLAAVAYWKSDAVLNALVATQGFVVENTQTLWSFLHKLF
jgi:hypothetical protein